MSVTVEHVTEYPNLRKLDVCVTCNGPKDAGCVLCWPCYRAKLRDGADLMTTIHLEACERMARAGKRPTQAQMAGW